MLTKKDPPRPIAPVGPSAPCYCLYVSPLITAPLDQVGWLTMGKRRAPTFLKSWTHTSTRTHALTCTHSQPGNGNHKKSPRGEQHATRFRAASVSNNQTDDRHQPQPEVRDAAVTRPPPSFKLLMQWGPSHHYTSTQYTPTHTHRNIWTLMFPAERMRLDCFQFGLISWLFLTLSLSQ